MTKKAKITTLIVSSLALLCLITLVLVFTKKDIKTDSPQTPPTKTTETPSPPTLPPANNENKNPSPKPTIIIEPRKNYKNARQSKQKLLPQMPPRLGEEIYGLSRNQLSCSAGTYASQNNKLYLLTAEHCGEGLFYSSNKNRIGSTSIVFPQEGIQAIHIHKNREESSPLIRHYRTEIPISGTHEPKVGERVCRTGAQSKTICNLIITRTEVNNVEIENETENKNNLIEITVEPNYEKYATGLGDSGGVVYRVSENNEALIVGILIGGGGEEKKCNVSVGRCFTKTYAYPIDDFIKENNFVLATTN